MTDYKNLLLAENEKLKNESVQDAATISMLEGQVETKDKQIALLTEAIEFMTMTITQKNLTVSSLLETMANDDARGLEALAKSRELGE